MEAIVNKPIRSLEQVEEGIAAFENAHRAYTLVGGPAAPESEMKHDVIAVLPKEIREALIWQPQTDQVTFSEFRDVIQAQTAKVLLARGGPGFHAVDERRDEPSHDGSSGVDTQADSTMAMVMKMQEEGNDSESIIAAINRMRGGGGGRAGGRPGGRPPVAGDKAPSERKCPNCGKVHLRAPVNAPAHKFLSLNGRAGSAD